MPDIYTTDCICQICGRRHIQAIDFDQRPIKYFGRYVVMCNQCFKMSPEEREEAMRKWIKKMESKPQRRRRK